MTLMGYSLLKGTPSTTLNGVADMVPISLAAVNSRATPTTAGALSGKLPVDATPAAGGQYSKKYSVVTYDNVGKAKTIDVYLAKNATTPGRLRSTTPSPPDPVRHDPGLAGGRGARVHDPRVQCQGQISGTGRRLGTLRVRNPSP